MEILEYSKQAKVCWSDNKNELPYAVIQAKYELDYDGRCIADDLADLYYWVKDECRNLWSDFSGAIKKFTGNSN